MKNLILIFVLVSSITKSQGDDENHRKYWYYRTRLVNDFTKVGTGTGNSFVFQERGIEPNGNGGYDHSTNSGYNTLKIGDGTSMLGYYMAVLATEWRLLKNNGQDLTKINHELFCALNAFNRVDHLAETYWGYAGNTNGCYTRDDVPADFFTNSNYGANNYTHFNYYNSGGSSNNVNNRGFCSSAIPNGMMNVNSTLQTAQAPPPTHPTLGGKDHTIDLTLGLALIAKLVDDGTNYNNNYFDDNVDGWQCHGDHTQNIPDEAKQIFARILNYMKNSNGHGNGLNAVWHVYDPGGTQVPSGDGGDVLGFAYPLSQAGCFVVNGLDEWGVTAETAPHACTNPSTNFNDNLSYNLNLGYSVFHSSYDLGGQGGNKQDFETMYKNLGAVCNCYYTPVGLAQANPALYNAEIILLNAITTVMNSVLCHWGCPSWVQTAFDNIIGVLSASLNINDTGYKLYSNETSMNILLHTEGLYDGNATGTKMFDGVYEHAILHGNSYAHSLDHIMQLLIDAAPSCGTYNYASYGEASGYSQEWSSSNRLEFTDQLGEIAQCPCPSSTNTNFPLGGDFPGLDYMLYHNLYYLYSTNYSAVDLSDRIINFNFPISGSLNSTIGTSILPSTDPSGANGSQGSPANVGAFETIVADNTIASNGDVTYQAGKTIHLVSSGGSQQFHVATGANFHAFIQPFSCQSSTGDYTRVASNDSTKPSLTSQQAISYPTSSMYEQATHGTGPIAWSPPAPQSNDAAIAAITSNAQSQLDAVNALINSRTTTANNLAAPITVDVFPNPSSGRITLQNTNASYTYTITDVLGSTVLSGQVSNNSIDVDLSVYQKGVYFVSFDNGNGYKQLKKVVIN